MYLCVYFCESECDYCKSDWVNQLPFTWALIDRSLLLSAVGRCLVWFDFSLLGVFVWICVCIVVCLSCVAFLFLVLSSMFQHFRCCSRVHTCTTKRNDLQKETNQVTKCSKKKRNKKKSTNSFIVFAYNFVNLFLIFFLSSFFLLHFYLNISNTSNCLVF